MKPVYQTRFGKDGNCFAACIASLLECSIEAVDFPMPDSPVWIQQWNDRLSEHGIMFLEIPMSEELPILPSGCLVLMCGKSKGGLMHSAIGRYDRAGMDVAITCIHDPISPDSDKAYLTSLQYIGFIARCFREKDVPDEVGVNNNRIEDGTKAEKEYHDAYCTIAEIQARVKELEDKLTWANTQWQRAVDENKRLREAIIEHSEVAELRGDNDLPHPCDDPKLWTARMIDSWDDLAVIAKEVQSE